MDQDFIIHINRQERTQAMEGVEQAVSQVYDNKEQPKEKLAAGVLEAVQNAMARGDRITVPVEIPKEAADKLVSEGTKTGDTVPFPANFQCKIRTLNLKSGAIVYAAFTSPEEADKGQRSSTVTEAIDTYLQKALMNPQVAGPVLFPVQAPDPGHFHQGPAPARGEHRGLCHHGHHPGGDRLYRQRRQRDPAGRGRRRRGHPPCRRA